MQVVFCDVGQGDAALIIDGSYQILIDGGPDKKVLSCLEKYLPFWDKALEVVIATHPDLDHIGGLLFVLERYQARSLLFIPGQMDSQKATEFQKRVVLKALSGDTRLKVPKVLDTYMFSKAVWAQVISPVFASSLVDECFSTLTETQLWDKSDCLDYGKNDKNELSIALKIHIHNTVILFTGDMGISTELSLKQRGLLQEVDVLKVGHHGSKTSTSKEFLEIISPETSVISVGKNNKYNHPFPQVLQQLEAIGSTILRTDTLGNIELLVFDDKYTVKLPV